MRQLLAVLLSCLAFASPSFSQETSLGMIPSLSILADSATHRLENLQAQVKENKVFLRWQAQLTGEESYFDIERSLDGNAYSLIGVLKNSGTGVYEYNDEAAPAGRVSYRVKSLSSGQPTASRQVSVAVRYSIQCKFYPNPVDQVLILRTEGPADLQISDPNGKPMLLSKLTGGLKVLDVSSLPAGVYVLSLFQKDGSLALSEKLVKK
jgi:hypothetical protein